MLMYNSNKFLKCILMDSCIRRFAHRTRIKTVKPKTTIQESMWEVIESSSIESPRDWKSVRTEILNNFKAVTPANIDSMTVGICTSKNKFDLAFRYLEHLKEENIKLNLATIGKYFKLLYVRGLEESLTKEEEEQILFMFDDVRRSYPVLDSITLESVIQALSLTKKWHLCTELIEEIKTTTTPTSTAYSAVAAAAFVNKADDLAWKTLQELLANGKDIHDVVYSAYFKNISKSSSKLKLVEKMFNFMQDNSVRFNANGLENFVDSLKEVNAVVYPSEVSGRGICKCCNNKLELFDLSEEEFINLKNKILQNAIVGKDVFNKTTAEELQRFKNFTSNMTKHDIIVDGLNVAYSAGVKQPPIVTSGLVSSVVSHFANQGKKVLLLGRKHMSKWPTKNWKFIIQNSTVFLTEDLSQDDPYLLYCALHSGKDTIIVTRDLMRSHKFLLKDVHLKNLFDRWLAQRQYMLIRVQEKGNPIFRMPLPFSQITQKNNGYWHVPYCRPPDAETTISIQWLCVKV